MAKNFWSFLVLSLGTFLLCACNNQVVASSPPDSVDISGQEAISTANQNISASSSINKRPTESVIVNGCIPPLETFAYPVGMDESTPSYPGNGPTIEPSHPWQLETSLPVTTSLISIITTRSFQGSEQIWGEMNNKFPELLIYYPETRKWDRVSAEVETSGVYVDKLFVAKDGTLWGQNTWDTRSGIVGQPVLSRYNDKTRLFEFEQNTQQIPAVAQMNFTQLTFWPEVILDSHGRFWIFVPKDAIYSYDPVTYKIESHAEISDLIVSDAALAPNGSIYFTSLHYLENGMTLNIGDIELFSFLPQTGEIKKIIVPLEPWPTFSSILVDHSGRLWLDSLGWQEPDGRWYQVHRSPIFITNVLWSGLEHRWKTPQILMESSDGRLWFRSDNGMAWLDPQQGEWCWFTTEQSNIVEDQEHNLWMVADNYLYKLDLNP